ncbi:hypothetical protein BJX70DRAFT_396849 [Aspergillus crustosus]
MPLFSKSSKSSTKSTKATDDTASTYSNASVSTLVNEKEEAKREWISKTTKKPAAPRNKDAALHNEAMAFYMTTHAGASLA